MLKHPDPDVADAFRKLQNALISWERNTGRESLLIYREAAGNFAMQGRLPTDFSIRLDNGISVDPANADLDDAHLLQRFTDAIDRSTTPTA